MTVHELLQAILKAYPGADADALATHKPAFYARFEKREGPHLEAAFNETLATFTPNARQPFPIAANIEQHMPTLRAPAEGGPPIRDKLDRRAAKARILLADWMLGQGAKIKAQRAPQLYHACMLVAAEMAKARALDDRISAIVLTQAEINHCYQAAISTERVKRPGARPPDRTIPEQWWAEVSAIAAEWGLDITPEWWSDETANALAEREAA